MRLWGGEDSGGIVEGGENLRVGCGCVCVLWTWEGFGRGEKGELVRDCMYLWMNAGSLLEGLIGGVWVLEVGRG